jgi:hypothetical protein
VTGHAEPVFDDALEPRRERTDEGNPQHAWKLPRS